MNLFPSIDALIEALRQAGYFADRRLATAVFLALKLERPLLLEG
jgi:MoxR-like ATPase